VHAISPIFTSRWFPWGVVASATVAAVWPHASSNAPPEPTCIATAVEHAAPPPLPALGPRAVPTRAVPCVNVPAKLALRSLAGDPVVCADTTCLRLDLDRLSATLVDPPAAPVALPTSAGVRQLAGQWSACRDTACKPVGPRLATALEHAASDDMSATFDLTTVVVADQIWNVAADRTVTLRPPEIRPNGPERTITVVGDVLLVKWGGGCTDSMCLVSHVVDRRGRELGWVEAGGRVVRLDNDHFLTVSEFSALEIRDLHRGTQVSEFRPLPGTQSFRDLVRLDDVTYALLRDVADGVEVSVIDVSYGSLSARHRGPMTLPTCDL
jgi:hypothetical protein